MLSVDNSRSGILCACVNLDEGLLYASSAVREAIRELTQQNYRKVQGQGRLRNIEVRLYYYLDFTYCPAASQFHNEHRDCCIMYVWQIL